MMVASRASAPVGAISPAHVVSAEAAEVNAPASTMERKRSTRLERGQRERLVGAVKDGKRRKQVVSDELDGGPSVMLGRHGLEDGCRHS